MTNRIETGVELVASAILAGAVGYATCGAFAGEPLRLAYAAGAAAVAFVLCLSAMKAAAGRKARFAIRIFDVRSLEDFGPDELLLTDQLSDELVLTASDRFRGELVLTDADRLERAPMAEPLVLDDVLAAVGDDSRVVRLFDRKAMPTPGQLSSSIERHLDRGGSYPDAAQALSDALAELRRSLR